MPEPEPEPVPVADAQIIADVAAHKEMLVSHLIPAWKNISSMSFRRCFSKWPG